MYVIKEWQEWNVEKSKKGENEYLLVIEMSNFFCGFVVVEFQ